MLTSLKKHPTINQKINWDINVQVDDHEVIDLFLFWECDETPARNPTTQSTLTKPLLWVLPFKVVWLLVMWKTLFYLMSHRYHWVSKPWVVSSPSWLIVTQRFLPVNHRFSQLLPIINPENIGDIFVSVDKVAEQADYLGHSFERELGFLCVHGFLHLNGYDHMKKADADVMFPLQKEILNAYGLKR